MKAKSLMEEAGFRVDYDDKFDSTSLRQLREHPPAVFVIDLSRLPSRGREIAIELRQSPKTRQVPLIFCDGTPEKVNMVRRVLPDAAYCTYSELITTLIDARPASAQTIIKPVAMMNRYGARTAAQKLGITEGSSIALVNSPRNINTILGELPDSIEFVEQGGVVTLCFANSMDDLRADMSRLRGTAAKTKLWVLWRKKTAPDHDGITDRLVREMGTLLGLVDYKICSVDKTWTAMLFARKK